nr:lipase/esterase [uncultured bacterium]
MKPKHENLLLKILLSLLIPLFSLQPTMAQEPATQLKPEGAPEKRGAFPKIPVDPRVQMRSYLFPDTNENIEYALFVSSKVSKDKKNPLIVTLHGLGAGPAIMLRGNALDLAEEGGYILVGPMGYNVRGWYGIPMGQKPGLPKTPPKTANSSGAPQPDAAATAKPKPSLFYDPNDPPNLRELSEKDVLNVLDIIRKEFNVDERRIYLMGHSMGGAGALYLAVKYPSIWAAIAAIAPAAFTLDPDMLKAIKDMPVMIVQGEKDNLVPAANTRRWVDKLKELNMTYEYLEMQGGDHGSVILDGNPAIYAFFAKHVKPARH